MGHHVGHLRLPPEIAQSMDESDQGLDSIIAPTAEKNGTPDARDLNQWEVAEAVNLDQLKKCAI